MRHLPVAHGRDASNAGRTQASTPHEPKRTTSEMRLQAAVVKQHAEDEGDPYADVPCTD